MNINSLRIGMFIRSDLGINRIISLMPKQTALDFDVETEKGWIDSNIIKEFSFEIKDLIKQGDFVNYEQVRGINKLYAGFDDIGNPQYIDKIYIYYVTTKEQFKRGEFKNE